VDDLESVDEVEIGEMMFYPPYLASMGVDWEGFVGVSELEGGRVEDSAA
jgi:hypothetical protein